MKWISLLFCVVGLAAAPVVNAQSSAGRAGSWETELGISFMNSSDADFEGGTSADFDSDIAWRFGVGYHYTDQLEFGGTLSFGQTDYDADVALDEDGDQEPEGFVRVSGDLDFMTLLGNATYNFMPGAVQPVRHRRDRLELGGYQHRDRAAEDRLLVGSVVGLRLHLVPGHANDRRFHLPAGCRCAL